ncbi:leucine-rich repeat protein [Verrucomicrobia bacterium]|nr:leucine-rich repeat protein [Verrucomicrobiota bacterium]
MTITYCDRAVEGELEIPAEIEGVTVTSIGYGAFRGCSSLRSIIIPESVTSIGKRAFKKCSSIESIDLPSNISSLPDSVFQNCLNLKKVTTSGTISKIGNYAFSMCRKLEEIPWSADIHQMGIQSFSGCSSLQNFTFYSELKSLSEYCFAYCKNLQSIDLPKSLEKIDEGAFLHNSSLTNISGLEFVKELGPSSFAFCSSLSEIALLPEIDTIEHSTFDQCFNLTSVGENVRPKAIEGWAFRDCPNLLEGKILCSEAESIGVSAFEGCAAIQNVVINDKLTTISQSSFKKCNNLSSIIIPESVTSIGDWAFYDCSSLSSIIFKGDAISERAWGPLPNETKVFITPDARGFGDLWNGQPVFISDDYAHEISGVTYAIGEEEVVIVDCQPDVSGSLRIPSTIAGKPVTKIFRSAFQAIENLKSVFIEDGVTTIGTDAFRNCSGLQNITIPKSITSIGNGAFLGCGSLETIVFEGDAPQLTGGAFDGIANNAKIFASSDARGFQTGWTGVLLVPNDLRKGSISETVLPVSDEHQAPGITNELSVSRMRVGDTLTLEANVRGTDPFVFQWFKNGKELNGATAPLLVLDEATTEDAGIYSLAVSNVVGESIKDVLDLRVLRPLALSEQPTTVEEMARRELVLEVFVEGDGPLAYEWFKNGMSLGVGVEPGLRFDSLEESDSGVYVVSVTSAISTLTSEPIELVVTPYVAPPVVTKELESQTVVVGTSLLLSVALSGEPPFSYEWVKDGEVVATTKDPFFLITTAEEEQSGSYSVQVSNLGGETPSAPALIRVLPPARIVSHPAHVKVMQTMPFSLDVIVTGGGEHSYRWLKDGELIPGATQATFSVDESDFDHSGQYKVVIETELGSLESESVSVLVTPLVIAPEIVAGPTSQKVDLGDSVSFTVVASGTEPFEYTWFHNGDPIDGANAAVLIIDSVTEQSLGKYTAEVKNDRGIALTEVEAVLRLWQPISFLSEPTDKRIILGEELRLEVQLQGDIPFTLHWEKDGEVLSGRYGFSLVVAGVSVDDAGIYQMVVDQRGQETRSGFIEVVVLVPPSISSQPIDQELLAGENFELGIDADGSQPIIYQLLREGDVFQENRSGIFVVESVTADLSGAFSVAISNPAGTTETDPFVLTILKGSPAILSQSTELIAGPGDHVELFVKATGGDTTYRWFKDGVLLEEEAQSILTIDSVNPESAGEYLVVVNNPRGVTISETMSLTMSAKMSITVSRGNLRIKVIGGYAGELWQVEQSPDLMTWELIRTVQLETYDEVAIGVLSNIPFESGKSFFRAIKQGYTQPELGTPP